MDRPILSEKERGKPYAAFYDRPLAAIPEERYAHFAAPMDAALGVSAAQMERLMTPEQRRAEGYCFLPEGGAYLAAYHFWPGVTTDIYKWWVKWYDGEDLRYALWYPGKHYMSRIGWMLEDIGRGPEDLYCGLPALPEVLGIQEETLKKNGFQGIIGSCMYCKPQAEAYRKRPPDRLVVGHFIRDVEGGMEILSRFWIGYTSDGNGMYYAAYPGAEVQEPMVQGLGRHCVEEFANLGILLPGLYEQESGKK